MMTQTMMILMEVSWTPSVLCHTTPTTQCHPRNSLTATEQVRVHKEIKLGTVNGQGKRGGIGQTSQ